MQVEYNKEIKEKDNGWYDKYQIVKRNGKPVDNDADYFVLRLDVDDEYGLASRRALGVYASFIFEKNPDLTRDIFSRLTAYNLRK